jgi:hypothetical protein
MEREAILGGALNHVNCGLIAKPSRFGAGNAPQPLGKDNGAAPNAYIGIICICVRFRAEKIARFQQRWKQEAERDKMDPRQNHSGMTAFVDARQNIWAGADSS